MRRLSTRTGLRPKREEIPELSRNPVKRFFQSLGPGVITGAADDDPSGIVTYSIAGAQLGLRMLWTAMLTSAFKWLALVLFAYVIAAFLVKPDWGQVLRATFIPSWPKSHAEWSTLVAILGTSISPYLFFWQSAQEIEEEKAKGHLTIAQRRGTTEPEVIRRKIDVGTGGFFSNTIMYFIILTAAFTLHTHGVTNPQTTKDIVSALQPLAGRFATLLFAIGIVGVGFLAIPTLAGSAAYAFSEIFRLRHGLDEKLSRARAFYGVMGLSIVLGIALTFTHIKPVDALFLTAVINGILAPPLLVGILLVACDRKIMLNQTSSMLGRIVVGITTVGMAFAAIALFTL